MSQKSKKNLKLLLCGATGRMGIEIAKLARKEGFQIVYGMSRSGLNWNDVDPKQVDMIIDFSQPAAFRVALSWAVENRKPFLSGTTGLKKSDFQQLKKASRSIRVLWASNMSVGIKTLRLMLPPLKILKGWNIQLEEAHHKLKKDKPSGTAMTLQEDLEAIVGRKLPPIVSVRGGATPGIHKITIRSKEEEITIEHTALNRAVFARGALIAARSLFDKKRAGFYDLSLI